jgi:hypothetical protein
MTDLSTTVNVSEEQFKEAIREKLTETTGPDGANSATVESVSAYGDVVNDLADEIRDDPSVPDGALVQRIVVDAQSGYVKVWYRPDDVGEVDDA